MSIKSPKVGIGVSTYRRPDILKWTLKRVLDTKQKSTNVFVSDDGSEDELTPNVIRSFGVPWTTGPNCGSVGNKNRLLRLLCDCDYIFIMEDDVEIKKAGWESFWINAHIASGIHHFTFSPPGPYGECLSTTKFKGYEIDHPKTDGGAFSFYTKSVLQKCGGFCNKFKGMGWGHCEYSERIWRAGLTGKERINHVKGSKLFVKLCDVEPTFTDRKQWSVENKEIWKQSRKEQWIKCPL